MTPKDVLAFAKEKNVKMVDLKFMDLPGLWQHITVPLNMFGEKDFSEGKGFDGSSIRGFQEINESDMILIPDPKTAVIDPFCDIPTLSLICNVKDPVTGDHYSRDPRYVAEKAEKYLISTGIADTSYWGPEAEFFIFDDVRYDENHHSSFYTIDSVEGDWNTGREEKPNLGYKPRYKEGYFPVSPTDSYQNLRNEMVMKLMEAGIPIETQHHEVASGGQAEIDIKYETLVKQADLLMLYKYIIKNVAKAHNKTVTFMPKPIFQDNGSGMHVHQSLWKGGKPLFYDEKGYAGLSQMGIYYIGGILAHASSLMGLCAPTTNSYKRLVPGYEAPVNMIYSQRNRSAACRIPMYSKSPASKRIEFRSPDASCNPYLAFSAMLLAGLDGIQKKIMPPAPIDKNLYDMPKEELKKIKSVPGSLAESLNALESDHDYLLKGNVFTKDVIETWIDYKRKKEVDPVRLRPTPYEFYLYYDI
jgi:glutamine synthetase